MDEFTDAASQRTAEYNLYFRIVSEGLTTRTAEEFHDELEGIAMHTLSPALKLKCEAEMGRFLEVGTLQAANLR